MRLNNTIGTTVSPTTVAARAGRYLTTDFSNGRLIGAYFDADTKVFKVRPLTIV